MKDKDEAQKHKIMNLEIRYRKFTLHTMKESCGLFKQRGLDLTQKLDNLKLLLQASNLTHKTESTMEDLESVIRSFGISVSSPQVEPTDLDVQANQGCQDSETRPNNSRTSEIPMESKGTEIIDGGSL